MLWVYPALLAQLLFNPFILCSRTSSNIPQCSNRTQCNSICVCEKHANCSILPIDEETRKSILYYHNHLRDIQCVSKPQPSGMTMLEYDNELEEISKCWAGRCTSKYTDCFSTTKFSNTSQTIVQLILENTVSPKILLWMQMMSLWLKKANSFSVDVFESLPIGKKYEFLHNFGQLMSDNVLAVGCAWSITDNLLTFVCTYGPRGPKPTEPIYSIGTNCTTCPMKYECDHKKPFTRLCKRKVEDNSTETMIVESTLSTTPCVTQSTAVSTSEKTARVHVGRRRNRFYTKDIFHKKISVVPTLGMHFTTSSTSRTEVEIQSTSEATSETPYRTPPQPPVMVFTPPLDQTAVYLPVNPINTQKDYEEQETTEPLVTVPIYLTLIQPAPRLPDQIDQRNTGTFDHSGGESYNPPSSTETLGRKNVNLLPFTALVSNGTVYEPSPLPNIDKESSVISEEPNEEIFTALPEYGQERRADVIDVDSDSDEENSKTNLIIFFSVGAIFIVIGVALFMLIMYTLKRTRIDE